MIIVHDSICTAILSLSLILYIETRTFFRNFNEFHLNHHSNDHLIWMKKIGMFVVEGGQRYLWNQYDSYHRDSNFPISRGSYIFIHLFRIPVIADLWIKVILYSWVFAISVKPHASCYASKETLVLG